jgi:hypothetical protein
MLIHCTHGSHLGGKSDGVIRRGVEPILDPMGLQLPLILKQRSDKKLRTLQVAVFEFSQ